MRRGGGKDEAPDKVMGPLFPRLHVNDTVKGGPRAPPRNKMALYEQFSVPSHRFSAAAPAPAPAPPWHAHRPVAGGAATSAVPSTSASQAGGSDRPLFPSFCVPSTEPVRSSDHMNANSNGRAANATRAESGRQSTHHKSKDTNAAGPTAECSSKHRENTNKNSSSGKKLANDDDFTVPSVLYSGIPPHCTQEKFTPFPTTTPYESVSAMSKSFAKCPNTDKRHLEGMKVSDAKSRESPGIREKDPTKVRIDMEIEERTSSFQTSKEKSGRPDPKVSSYRDRLNKYNDADKKHSEIGSYQMRSRKENAVATQDSLEAETAPSSKPYADMEQNGNSDLLECGLRETGEKRKRSRYGVEQNDDLSDSSVESLPEMEISPDDVVGAIGPKHFWKARRAIVNQQRVFAVQVFELHRLIKVQKLIAASPHLLIEGDPCLGKALVASKKKLAGGDTEKQLQSAKNKVYVQPAMQQLEHIKDNTDANQPSPTQDDVVAVQHNNQAAANAAVSSNPPTMPTPSDNKQNSWCAAPPPNQWLVPVMSPSEGLVFKPYTGHCPPPGSFLAPFYASCAPVRLPSTAGDFMSSPYGIPMPHQPQHMGVPGPPPMQPMYFPPFSMPVMNTAVSASAVEQVSHVAASQPNGHREQHSRSSCNMSNLRGAALSAGIWRFHPSKDSELQGSSASSPFDRQQSEGRAAPSFPASSVGNGQPQPSSGSRENPGRVIKVVPHTSRTASESAARIFQSIQMERQQNDS
ncbi:Protein EARLY FLOWERING 3 [Dichanthelium oligosanthes]|uniref:Protein EARLY FLOWERING 3 n=1 Tax=Dichanthelium oligosanthes TaxID=888268 RepID=A0A1E5VXZ2_9POAL|nr:Protein EARLY FLOWERING 3 [Dichanthelium oligosanthes]